MIVKKLFIALAAAFLLAMPASADVNPTWTAPFPPFRIAGNAPGSPRTGPGSRGGLYYVGSQDLAAYLLVTPQGDILINSNLTSSPALIRKSVEALGFHWSDIKILLISHAHYDHCAGSAEILRETHAKYEVMAQDVSVVQSGGRTDFQYANDKTMAFPPAHVDRILHDSNTVSLGGTTLTAHLTAGHTKGTTTWTLDENEGGRTLHVVIVGSPNVNPGYELVRNIRYPRISDDFRHQFQVLSSLPCDIFLGAHGLYFGLQEKYSRFKAGDRNAFIDPAGYKAYVADRQQAFEGELKRQSGK
ncbi:MAG TPA: subclass B3 metallo-beta-lactamase [Terracidiphilus sp.]|nr:subclass B3 metallo-beta-lactamase [Terracidiphilus sp.]